MLTQPSLESIRWSEQNIIDLIRKVRNDLVKDFLDERHLIEYLSTSYRMREVSRIKVEMIRNELKDLLINPVDVKHYQSLIDEIRQNDSASITGRNEELFYAEIERILKKYIY